MIWIEAEDVILIHSRIIHVTGGIDGLRDRAGVSLKSAHAVFSLHPLIHPDSVSAASHQLSLPDESHENAIRGCG